jgi:Glycosyl transferase family 64 domain
LNGDAVFMVDDDIRVDCVSLQLGAAAWYQHPTAMVGYYPRLAAQAKGKNKRTSLVYMGWPGVFLRQEMNFILPTKAAFLNKQYMELYFDPALHPIAVLQYVDKHFNCEDVAMSMLILNYTKYQSVVVGDSGSYTLPVVYVEGFVSDQGLFGGISTGTRHFVQRSQCLNDLTNIYLQQGWPAPFSPTDGPGQILSVSLRESSYIRHFPGFWWQARPSNIFEWFALQNIFK